MNVPTGPPDAGGDPAEAARANVDPWANVARVGLGPGGTLSVVEGATFLISDLRGDVLPGGAHGLFHRDTRFLSRLELTVDGRKPEILAARTVDPYSARFVLRLPWDGPRGVPAGDDAEPLRRERPPRGRGDREPRAGAGGAGRGDRDRRRLRGPLRSQGAGRRRQARRDPTGDPRGGLLALEYEREGFRRGTEVRFTAHPEEISWSGARFGVTIPPGGSWRSCIEVCLDVDEQRCVPGYACDAFGGATSPVARRAAAWRARFPALRSGSEGLAVAGGRLSLRLDAAGALSVDEVPPGIRLAVEPPLLGAGRRP